MYVDRQLSFSVGEALGAITAGSFGYSENWLDLNIASREIGVGIPLYIVVNVSTAFVAAGNGTFEVAVVSDSANAIADGSSRVHSTIMIFDTTATTPAAGTTMVAALPIETESDTGSYLRYLSLRYGPVGQNLTSGSVDAFITDVPQRYTSYPKGYTIS